MYTNPRYTISVRDPGASYGPRPTPAEDFEAAGVLDDLRTADGEAAVRILARYAALRAWLLRPRGGPVAGHALSAARDHLEAADPTWEEGRILTSLLDTPEVRVALELLERAATAADGDGHAGGALALRQARHRVRWRAARLPPPSTS